MYGSLKWGYSIKGLRIFNAIVDELEKRKIPMYVPWRDDKDSSCIKASSGENISDSHAVKICVVMHSGMFQHPHVYLQIAQDDFLLVEFWYAYRKIFQEELRNKLASYVCDKSEIETAIDGVISSLEIFQKLYGYFLLQYLDCQRKIADLESKQAAGVSIPGSLGRRKIDIVEDFKFNLNLAAKDKILR